MKTAQRKALVAIIKILHRAANHTVAAKVEAKIARRKALVLRGNLTENLRVLILATSLKERRQAMVTQPATARLALINHQELTLMRVINLSVKMRRKDLFTKEQAATPMRP
ncbi:hypothetical protein [Mucilaginibacter antarcticus]|uniref:hypothetical protein n=1 Tax=Mucilaginibacter antarcticus TaxID=1855725 RepID=UPI00362FBBC5